MTTGLLCALVGVGILDPQSQHDLVGLFGVKYVLDLPLELEKIILP